ncbi:unnamed protein product [Gadus morhua 'NCC']
MPDHGQMAPVTFAPRWMSPLLPGLAMLTAHHYSPPFSPNGANYCIAFPHTFLSHLAPPLLLYPTPFYPHSRAARARASADPDCAQRTLGSGKQGTSVPRSTLELGDLAEDIRWCSPRAETRPTECGSWEAVAMGRRPQFAESDTRAVADRLPP